MKNVRENDGNMTCREKKTNRFEMRLSDTVLSYLRILAVADGVSMAQEVEQLVLMSYYDRCGGYFDKFYPQL